MKLSKVTKAIKEGLVVYCGKYRLLYDRNSKKFLAMMYDSDRKVYSLSGIRYLIKKNINELVILDHGEVVYCSNNVN